MRKLVLLAAAIAVLVGGSTALAGSAGVNITATGFTPQNPSVQAGDSITWTNSDVVRHRVVVSGTQCTLVLEPSQTSSCTFPTAGSFTYDDPSASGPGFSGTVTVAPNTRSVTLNVSRNVGIFGDSMTLGGTASGHAAGEQVTVVARPVGLPETRTIVTTTAGGNWTLLVQPRVKTTYQVLYDTAQSTTKTINVRPRLTFQKVGRYQYLVVVLGAHSFAGKQLDVARRIGGRYVTFKRVTITRIARTTTTSVAYFNAVVRPGTHLRAFLPQNQAGTDYLDGHSNFIVQ